MKVLVIQGAGMEMRGRTQVDIFGPMTLDQINERVHENATELGVNVTIFHSNSEGEVVDALFAAADDGTDAAIINTASFMESTGPLRAAISQVSFPVIEIHMTNPVARGVMSTVLPRCQGSVTGFGLDSYYVALVGLRRLLSPG